MIVSYCYCDRHLASPNIVVQTHVVTVIVATGRGPWPRRRCGAGIEAPPASRKGRAARYCCNLHCKWRMLKTYSHHCTCATFDECISHFLLLLTLRPQRFQRMPVQNRRREPRNMACVNPAPLRGALFSRGAQSRRSVEALLRSSLFFLIVSSFSNCMIFIFEMFNLL